MRLQDAHLDRLLDILVEEVVARLLAAEARGVELARKAQEHEMETPAELTGSAGASVSIQGMELNNADSDTAAVTTAT